MYSEGGVCINLRRFLIEVRRFVNPGPAEGSITVRRAFAKLNRDTVGVIYDMPKCAGHPEGPDQCPCSEDSKIRGFGLSNGPKTGGLKGYGNQIKRVSSPPYPCSSVSATRKFVQAWLLRGFKQTNCLRLA